MTGIAWIFMGVAWSIIVSTAVVSLLKLTK